MNQAPPSAQQLRLPDDLMMPHLGHDAVAMFVGGAVAVVDTKKRWLYKYQNMLYI